MREREHEKKNPNGNDGREKKKVTRIRLLNYAITCRSVLISCIKEMYENSRLLK